MHRDADKRLKALLDSDPALKQEFEEKFKLTHDPRITRVGKFLRKFSIDELPQFFQRARGPDELCGAATIVDDEVKYYKEHSLVMVPRPARSDGPVAGLRSVGHELRCARGNGHKLRTGVDVLGGPENHPEDAPGGADEERIILTKVRRTKDE